MDCHVPAATRCCFFFPLHPGILIYGIIRFNIASLVALLYVYFLVSTNMIAEIHFVFLIIIEAVVIIDVVTIAYFLYGYNTKNVRYLKKFYPFCVYALGIKMLVYFMFSFVIKSFLVIPYIICLTLDSYMLILIKSMMKEGERQERHCEFINKLANPGNIINIEVVDDSIPDIYKNRVFLITDRYDGHFNGNFIGNTVINEAKNKNHVRGEQKAAEKNCEQPLDNISKINWIPAVTESHM